MSSSTTSLAYDPAVDAPKPHHPVYDYDSGPPVDRGKFAIWLFLVLGFGAFFYVTENGPAWLVFPLFFAILLVNVSLQMINEDGEKNFRQMNDR